MGTSLRSATDPRFEEFIDAPGGPAGSDPPGPFAEFLDDPQEYAAAERQAEFGRVAGGPTLTLAGLGRAGAADATSVQEQPEGPDIFEAVKQAARSLQVQRPALGLVSGAAELATEAVSDIVESPLDVPRQVGRNLAESGYATALGSAELLDRSADLPANHPLTAGVRGAGRVARNLGLDDLIEGLRSSREEAREFYGEPETTTGRVAGGATRFVADAAQFMAPYAVASRAGLIPAGASLVQRIAAQVATGAPLDAAMAASGPENSLAGGLAEITGNPFLEGIAEDVSSRVAFDVASGAALGSGLEALGDLVRAVGRNAQPPPIEVEPPRATEPPGPEIPATRPEPEAVRPEAESPVPPPPEEVPVPDHLTGSPLVQGYLTKLEALVQSAGRDDIGVTTKTLKQLEKQVEQARKSGAIASRDADDLIDRAYQQVIPAAQQREIGRFTTKLTRMVEAARAGKDPAGKLESVGARLRKQVEGMDSLTPAQRDQLQTGIRTMVEEAKASVPAPVKAAAPRPPAPVEPVPASGSRADLGPVEPDRPIEPPTPRADPERPAAEFGGKEGEAAVTGRSALKEVPGSRSDIKLPDGASVPARYALVEASDVITSHDPYTFDLRPEYPENVQNRRYHADKVAQEDVARVAQQLDPEILLDRTVRATEGPPIITADGIALSGNTRTMALLRARGPRMAAAQGERFQAYTKALRREAESFGLSPEAVTPQSILVRVVDDPALDLSNRASLRELAAAFNDVATKAKDPLADAAVRAVRMREADRALDHFGRTFDPDQTLRNYLGTAPGREFVTALVDDGVIRRAEIARFTDPAGTLSEEGRSMVERMMYLAAVGDPEVVSRAPASVLQKLEHAIPAIVQTSRIPGWDVSPVVREGLDLHTEIRSHPEISTVEELLAQGTLFSRSDTREGVTLARFIESRNKADIGKAFRSYARRAREATGQAESVDMFGFEPPEAPAVFRSVFESPETGLVLELHARYRAGAAIEDSRLAFGEAINPDQLSLELMASPSGRFVTVAGDPEFKLTSEERLRLMSQAPSPRARIDFHGKKVKGPKDLADLLRPLRDPRMEKLHVVLTDDAGRVLSHTVESSGALNYVWLGDQPRFVYQVSKRAKRLGATRAWLAHNHPSGNPRPSPEDGRLTRDLDREFRKHGLRVEGQVVLDHGTYFHIPADVTKAQQRFTRPVEREAKDWTQVDGPMVVGQVEDLARVMEFSGRSIPDGGFLAVYLDTQARVVAVEPHRQDAFLKLQQRGTTTPWIEQRRRGLGASSVIVVVEDRPRFLQYASVASAYNRNSMGQGIFDVMELASSNSAAHNGLLRAEFERRDIDVMSRRLFEEPEAPYSPRGEPDPETLRKADSGELAPGSPLVPGWTASHAKAKTKAEPLPAEEGQLARPGTGLTAPARSAIIERLSEVLQVPIRVGKLGGRVLGRYKVNPEVIRLQVANDIETVSHEVGHHMHKLLFGTDPGGRLSSAVLRPWADELVPLGRGVSDETAREGLAEFFRRYLTNPAAAQRRAPTFYLYAESRLASEFPEVQSLLLEARKNYDIWLQAGPRQRLKAQISLEEKPELSSIRDRWTRFRENMIHDNAWIERAVDDLRGGASADKLEVDAGLLARLARGANGMAREWIEGSARSFFTLNRVGPGLQEIMKPVRAVLDDFRDYGVARRALELHRRGVMSGIDQSDAEAVLAELDSSLFRETWDELQQWNTHLLTYLRDAGVLSNETYSLILEGNKDYLPFYRVHEKGSGGWQSRRFGHVFSPIKRIRGSGREIIDPFESLVKNAFLYMHVASRQRVSRALVELSLVSGSGRWIEHVPTPTRKLAGVTWGEMVEAVEKKGDANDEFLDWLETIGVHLKEDLGEGKMEDSKLFQELLAVFRPGDYFQEPNVISYLRPDGKRSWYQVHPELYDAVMGFTDEELQAWLRWLGVPARTLRAGAVLSPDFIARNPVRDQLHAFVVSEYGFKPGFDFVRGLFHILGKSDLYGRFRASGADGAALVALDRESFRRTFRQMVEKDRVPFVVNSALELLRAIPAFDVRRAAKAAMGVVEGALEPLRMASELLENATRVGEFAKGLPKGSTRKEADLAAASAREVGTDFSRHGAKTKAIRGLTAFWNARVQGYDQLFRVFRRHPVRTSARIFAGITLPSILLYYVNRDDPEYWEIPQWQRDLFWVVKVHGVWLRIPKPFELGIVFGSLPERVLEWMDTNDPEGFTTAMKDFVGREAEGVLLGATPFGWQATQPLVENFANYSFFTRRPIVPQSQMGFGSEKVAGRYQASPYSSELAKGLGRMMNYSPRKIDNLIYSWSGGLGRTAVDASTQAWRSIGKVTGGKVGATTDHGDPPESDKLFGPIRGDTPMIRGFVVRPPGYRSQSVDRFYRELARLGGLKGTADYLRRENRSEEFEAWMKAHGEDIARYDGYRAVADQMSGMMAGIGEISRSPTLSGQQKTEDIRAIGREMTALARQTIGARTYVTERRR